MKICVESHHLFLLRGEVEEGLTALYDGSNPLPLQMLLIKEKEVEVEEEEEEEEEENLEEEKAMVRSAPDGSDNKFGEHV